MVDCHIRLDRRIAGGKRPFHVSRGDRLAARGRRNREVGVSFRGLRCCIIDTELDVDFAIRLFGPGGNQEIVYVDRRHAKQFHRFGNAAVVEARPGLERNDFGRRAVSFRRMPSIGSLVGFSTRTARRFFSPGLIRSVTSRTNGVSPPSWPPTKTPLSQTSAK